MKPTCIHRLDARQGSLKIGLSDNVLVKHITLDV
jgi:hypothetical protein